MYCRKCGAPLKDGAVFCARCGEPVPAAQPTQPPAPPPQARPRSPFEPAQRTADRVFPSQQRAAARGAGTPYPPQQPHSTQPFTPAAPPGAAEAILRQLRA